MNSNPITQEYLKEIFDYRDGSLIRKIKTCRNVIVGDAVGTVHNNGYLRVQISRKLYYVHRLIFMMHHGYFPKEIDHIDGNPQNNKIENLREATHLQNGKNLAIKKTNKSGVSGVGFCKTKKKWYAIIRVDGRQKNLGRFKNFEDAVEIRKNAEIKYFGEWLRMNQLKDKS